MKIIWMLALLACLRVPLYGASPDAPALPEDWRVTRDLQQKAYGAPELGAEPGATGDLLLGAAQLGAVGAPMGSMKNQDYDALYAMLQRYRDELVGLGLDYDKLMQRLDSLRQQADDLRARLDKYHPLDGAKIHGEVSTGFDNFRVTGKRAYPAIPGASLSFAKPAYAGMHYATGVNRADVIFEFTRGIASGSLELDMSHIWTSDFSDITFRRNTLEVRTPVVIQFGVMDLNLTPLTLWRNEDQYPFEPEPYKSRRERARKAYHLVPNKWEVAGFRFSTDMQLFNTLNLIMESTTSIVGQPGNTRPYAAYAMAPVPPSTASDLAVNVHTTYMEAYRIAIPSSVGLGVAYQGVYFTDDTQSAPNSIYTQFHSLAHSVSARFEQGPFYLEGEYGMSGLIATRRFTLTATARPELTGTAMTAAMGAKGDWGRIKLFGRAVSSNYNAAGAQGRTQDRGYEFLGPLLTETSYVTANGDIGYGLVPLPPQSRWNNHLIPPSVYRNKSGTLSPMGDFGFLLPYSFLASMSPYGLATPNRQGFGAEGELNFWDKLLVPKAGYEAATEMDPVVDSHSNTFTVVAKPFTFQQIRAGMDVNFKLGWDWKVTGGWTMNDTRNGELSRLRDMNGNLVPYALTSNLYEGGLEGMPSETLSLYFGHRHLVAVGVSEAELVSRLQEVGYDSLAYGLRWDVTTSTRLDVLYETFWFSNPEIPTRDYDGDSGIIRIRALF